MAIDHLLDDPSVRLFWVLGFLVLTFVETLPVLVVVLLATLSVTGRRSARATWRRPDGRALGMLALPYLGLALGTVFVASQLGAEPDRQHVWRMVRGTYPLTLGLLVLSAVGLGVVAERLRPFGSWVTLVVVCWICVAAVLVVTICSPPFTR